MPQWWENMTVFRSLPSVFVAAVLAAIAFGQTNADDPIKTTLCEIVKAPEQFNGKTVQVRAEYVSKFQWTGLKDESCSASIPLGTQHPFDDLLPEQGEYAFTMVADDNDHPERLHWKPIERLPVVDPKKHGEYRKLQKYAASKFKWPDGGTCQDCPLYRIVLTAVGRFDYFPTQTVSVRANPVTKALHYSAGEPNLPLLRLVLNSVSNVATTPIDPSVYTEKKGRNVTLEEAHELVTKLIRDHGSSGFSLDPYKNMYYPGFQFFQVMGDDPGGSIHYAVDLKTGEVWSGVICENMTSHSLKKLQKSIRKRIALTEDEHEDAPKNGPMCEPGMPRASKAK
jgi:hypothetical protein